MTLENFYRTLGGDYSAVLSRIPSEAMVKRFVTAFQQDPSFEALCSAMAAGDRTAAFRAAHTLKGVCANLGFETLRRSASALTEVLRPEADAVPAAAPALLAQVRRDYQDVSAAIAGLLAQA